jgi:hypothetical protein
MEDAVRKAKEIARSGDMVLLSPMCSSFDMFKDYPVAGVGLRNFYLNGRKYGATAVTVVHNSYLEILTGGGLLSFLPFALILVNVWRKLRLRKHYDGQERDLLICLKASLCRS